MNCPSCHNPVPEDHNTPFCPVCGEELSSHRATNVVVAIAKALFFGVLIIAGGILLIGAIAFAGCVCSGGPNL